MRSRIFPELGAELSQEYTDSPYTSNSHREKIIMLNERVLLELNQLLRIGREMVNSIGRENSRDEVSMARAAYQ